MSAPSGPDERFAASRAARPCGECTACCTALEVRELQKPRGLPCVHLCAAGCGVYAERPETCRRFDCLWRLGFARDDDRPDRLGVIFDITPRDRDSQLQAIIALEARPGALADPKVRYQLDRHAKRHLLILVGAGQGEVLGPPALVARWRQSRSRAALGL